MALLKGSLGFPPLFLLDSDEFVRYFTQPAQPLPSAATRAAFLAVFIHPVHERMRGT